MHSLYFSKTGYLLIIAPRFEGSTLYYNKPSRLYSKTTVLCSGPIHIVFLFFQHQSLSNINNFKLCLVYRWNNRLWILFRELAGWGDKFIYYFVRSRRFSVYFSPLLILYDSLCSCNVFSCYFLIVSYSLLKYHGKFLSNVDFIIQLWKF